MKSTIRRKVVVLSGGVGAAKLLNGLVKVIDPSEITAIVNVADDTDLHGLHISPDLDTVTYTLAGEIDPQRGWGLVDESWNAMDMISRYGGVDWFQLGDKDLGTHMYRTHRLLQGASLTAVTEEIARSLKVRVNILPVSDDPVKTFVTTSDLGEMEFQEYFVRHQHNLKVTEVHFKGIENATPGPNVIDEIKSASAIIIAPSNPIVSISPILSVPGVSEALQQKRDSTVAVSGIINGKALKGPADRMLLDLGHEVSPEGIAKIYQDLASKFVLDQADTEHLSLIHI